MNTCLEVADLQAIGNDFIADFERQVASIPKDQCAPFHDAAQKLEIEVLAVYKFTALFVRRLEDMEQISAAWQSMVETCDSATKKLSTLHDQHPFCGAGVYYDRVLDLRNKCARLQQMHS